MTKKDAYNKGCVLIAFRFEKNKLSFKKLT